MNFSKVWWIFGLILCRSFWLCIWSIIPSLNAAPVTLTQKPYIIICLACSFFIPITKLHTPATTGWVPGASFLDIFSEYDFKKLIPYQKSCDYFLFDTKGKLPGGNGYAFDWKILKNYTLNKPFFLSGGIGPKHVSKIKKLLKTNLPIYAIDINSKFEIKPGLKKIEIIEEFKNKINEL